METNKEDALKAKEMAEKRFAEKDFLGAKSYAIKARTLYPELDGVSEMIATFEIYIASESRYNGQIDHYRVLGLNSSADKYTVKKQYKKMAVVLHPDRNKCVGADGAFKFVSDAWRYLSLKFDRRRKENRTSSNVQSRASAHSSTVTGDGGYSYPSTPRSTLDTFWTVCTSCKVQYEYLRKYLNKRLSCKNCRGTFIAVETGAGPMNGSFPYGPWSYVPAGPTTYPSHGYDAAASYSTNGVYYASNGVPTYHSGHGYENVTNMSYQWSPHSSVPARVRDSSGVPTKSTSYNGKTTNGIINRADGNVSSMVGEPSGSKAGRPEKKRRVSVGASFRSGCDEKGSKSELVAKSVTNVITRQESKQCFISPVNDIRKLLIEKARKQIKEKVEAIRSASEAAAAAAAAAKAALALKEKEKAISEKTGEPKGPKESSKRGNLIISGRSISINVPDPDFHDFDKDRSEDCFKPKQVWAIYDEDDGMPRLYCLIREIISANPFKIQITYLNSKTDSEFGNVNWIDSGFTKSCGHFRAWNSDVIDQINIFSHLLKGEKAGRGGCVRIFPKSGDIWAVYQNWSPDWDRFTPDEVRLQYELVEVLDDYSEDFGVWIAPLVKVAGFKTVYQRDPNKDAVRWISRREMVRFSHQVPSWLIGGEEHNLPENCWDLDPAATPDQLLNAGTKEAGKEAMAS